MSSAQTVAAELLEASAQGYAAAANALLRNSAPVGALAVDASTWKAHLTQRILELAAAVRAGEPALFARRIAWLRRAVLARGADESDLRRAILSLKAALELELPENLRATVAPALDAGAAALDAPPPSGAASTLDAAHPTHRLVLQYLATCLEGATSEAIRIVLAAVERGIPAAVVYIDVLLAAQKEIGELWHMGEVSVAEERLVSETTRDLMALLVARYAPLEEDGRCLVAAAVAGNEHDIGLRAASDLFRLAGWRCLFLGANMPDADIAGAADVFGAQLVLLNATLATQLKPLGETIATIRALAPGTKILVGGLAFAETTELWRKLGADAFAATIETVVARGEELVPRPRR